MSGIDKPAEPIGKAGFDFSHPEVRRFGKYGLVGISSLVVGWATVNALYFTTHRLVMATAVGYALSVANGFIWNRRWTFKERRGESIWAQSGKFALINAIGYAINTGLLVLLLAVYTHAAHTGAGDALSIAEAIVLRHGGPRYSFIVLNACGLSATAVVTVWNFAFNRSWAFKH